MLAAIATGRAEAATLGARIDNVAAISYVVPGGGGRLTTPPASFVIEAARTPSTIEFFRYSPATPGAAAVRLNGSDYDAGAGFAPVGPLRAAGGALINTAAPVMLAPASAYFPGEPIIVKVEDQGQNGDPARIDTIIATIRTQNGDVVTLRLYESGASTGIFYAWIPSNGGAPVQNDPVLTIANGSDITARYQDPFDATEVSTDVAGVDPFGRVFDSHTGALLDGVTVTIVDDASGLPARVVGIDGVSAYPSTVTTGAQIVDAGGVVYALAPGEFRFPILSPGTYRFVVTPPAGYSAPSTMPASAFAAIQNAPFTIAAGSYGGAFTLVASNDIELDFPLDPSTDLLLRKAADADTAAIGDFVRYRITIDNRAANASAARIADTLPQGFRYQKGSARLGAAALADPAISPDGRTLTFDAGLVASGATAELSYVAEVASGAIEGPAVNRAVAIDAIGGALSNRAEAAIVVADDFFRSSLTIAGRLIEDGCGIEQSAGERKGVEGVRLYMETGATVVTDKNGLYHFEDVTPRTHVVQVDEASLPDGYELVLCKDDTRRAGSARSQFVDATGGKLWRADFYLKKTADRAAEKPHPVPAFNAETEYLSFDKAWLDRETDATPAFVYPSHGVTLAAPTANIGVRHAPGLKAELFLNGRAVATENFAGRDVSASQSVAVSRWRGVDLLEGENRLEAALLDANGVEVARISRTLDFINEVRRATLVEDQTHAIADGQTRPVIALRITDGAGRPVRAGRLLDVTVSPPFRSAEREAIENNAPLDAPLSAQSGIPVGQGGIALIELEPTVETGLARIAVKLDGGESREFTTYVKPATRDWIVVGLAEGVGGFERRDGAAKTPDGSALIGDGRVAGFAKGTIKGDWVVTLAGDTANERGDEDSALFDVIDPDDRYPLYGDQSNQRFEAQSRYPVYLKAEKDGFKAAFGDYETGMTEARLARYSRRLSGLQAVYESERLAFTGFAAETNQAFVKDELAADGTSGPFMLSAAPLVRNSETIMVETRDRFRPDVIVETTPLIRYADYDIDFETGEIIFRLPVPAADAAFNPNVIVIDYETAAPVERNLTAGGRGAIRFMDGRAEIGASFIHEEAPGIVSETTNLAGADIRVGLTERDELRIEYATSFHDGPGVDERRDAVLAEWSHTGERLAAKGYYSRVEPDFGLAQQTTATAGALRYGAEASFKLGEIDNAGGTARGGRYIDAKAYHEESLVTGAARDLAELSIRQESNSTSGSLGLRAVREQPVAAAEREGLFAIASVKQRFGDLGLSLRAAREQAIAGDNASALFPTRTSFGFDQQLFDVVTLSATHEILAGDAISQANTTVGLTAEPWSGGKLTIAGDRSTQGALTGDSGERIGATFGVDQQVRISDHWSGSLGVARREDLKSRGAVDAADDILPDLPRSPFEEAGGDYTSLYIGAGYRNETTTGSARYELKTSDISVRSMVTAGAAREVSEQLSFAAAGRYQIDDNQLLPDERRFDFRLGAAWRPHDDGLMFLNRFDVKQREIDQASQSWKAVHNLTLNAMATDRLQIALNHGFKYAVLTADGVRHDGVTELLGVEARYDVTEKVDLGFHAEGIYSFNAGTLDYAFGPSIGFTPAENMWLSLGYNIKGFVDEDFAAAEYSRTGIFLKLRIKFDQTTAKGLLDAISPDRAR